MFKCEICGKTTNPREKMTKITFLYRDKVYQGKKFTSFGREIEKELSVCEKCAEAVKKEELNQAY